MGSRLGARGLAIAVGVIGLMLLGPTPVPRHMVEAWASAQAAARAGDAVSAERSLATAQLVTGWAPILKADAVRLALANRDGPRALALLDDAPAPLASQATIACWRAEALALTGQWQPSTAELSSVGAAGCAAPLTPLRALAASELEAGDIPAAASILRALVNLYPADRDTAALLGACLAIEDPESAQAVIQGAAAHGDPLALDLAAALSEIGPGESSAALAASGQVFLKHSLWPLAAEAFRRLVDLEPRDAIAHAYYGLALDQRGLDGLPEIETAARLDPRSPVAQSLLGLHWQLRGQSQKAIPYLEAAVALDPANSAFRASLAAAVAEAGDVQAAIAEYQRAAEIRPTDPLFWRLLAGYSIAQELELSDTGLPAARNAAALDPADPDSLDLAGYAHFLLGDLVTAERLITRSVELDPTSASARLHYGLLLSSAGRLDEARAQLSTAVRLGGASPDGLLAQRALAQLGG